MNTVFRSASVFTAFGFLALCLLVLVMAVGADDGSPLPPCAPYTATATELIASPPTDEDPTAFLDPTQLYYPTHTPTPLIANTPIEPTEVEYPPADGQPAFTPSSADS